MVLITAPLVQGETFVCTTEAIAGVSDMPDGVISGTVYSGSRTFLYAQIDGRWVVKPTGYSDGYVLFDHCDGFICQSSEGYAGTFIFDKQALTFSATWFGEHTLMVGKGRCTGI